MRLPVCHRRANWKVWVKRRRNLRATPTTKRKRRKATKGCGEACQRLLEYAAVGDPLPSTHSPKMARVGWKLSNVRLLGVCFRFGQKPIPCWCARLTDRVVWPGAGLEAQREEEEQKRLEALEEEAQEKRLAEAVRREQEEEERFLKVPR